METKVIKKNQTLTLLSQNYHLRKYRILEMLDSQPLKIARQMRKELPKILGITRQTFASWCNAPKDSNLEISSIHLLTLAGLFEVEPIEMLNTQIPSLSLTDFAPRPHATTKKITGLTL